MKSGLIVYLAGGAELSASFDLASHCQEIGFPTDRVELAGFQPGLATVEDAWHRLFAEGYENIRLLVAYDLNSLRSIHPPVRLSG
jgi:hypothetical protein